MTPAQFDQIALAARMRPHSKAREAARMYILEGQQTQSDIAQALGMHQTSVSQAVARFIKAWRMVGPIR
jgi:DNA-binding MarR family transcriptional regulator